MAHVTQDPQVRERLEHFLAYAYQEWSAVPKYETEFNTWDSLQQLAFVHEWAIRESALDILRDFDEQGAFTPTQRERYAKLLKVVAKNRSTIDNLLKD